jgi:hypothetical protein
MSLSQKWGPQVFHHVNGKSCESFSREAFASVPLKVRQASSRTILFVHNDTDVLTLRQSNVLDTLGPFPEIEERCRRM